VLQFKPHNGGSWENIATVRGAGTEGFFTTRVQMPTAGGVRISWAGPGGIRYVSRVATVS
jgi:hypothetical protein